MSNIPLDRIRTLEANIRRIMDHLGLEYVAACTGYGCGKPAIESCALCSEAVCGKCMPHCEDSTRSYISSWNQESYYACSAQCVARMKEYEKKEPLSTLLRSGKLASEEYKCSLFMDLDTAIYERIFKNCN